MKRIKLYAYFAQNLGDDLMVRLLLEQYPQCRFYSDSWLDAGQYPNFENRESLQRKHGRLNHILNLLTLYIWKDFYLNAVRKHYERECFCSVHIGGSIYMQQTQPRWEEEKLKNGPLFVIGANFGPNEEVKAFADYFSRCGGVTFRDRASCALFSGGNIRCAPDVVLNLNAKPEESNGTVLISVIDLERRPELKQWTDSYEKWMARLCSACIAEGETPVLMSFCQKEGDEDAISRILGKLPSEHRAKVRTLCYRGDAAPILTAYAQAERVVATRFHAMILALCFEKPFFSISYSGKVENVLHDLNFDGFCSISNLCDLRPEDILNRCALPEGLAEYKRQAENQFAQLDRFLGEQMTW